MILLHWRPTPYSQRRCPNTGEINANCSLVANWFLALVYRRRGSTRSSNTSWLSKWDRRKKRTRTLLRKLRHLPICSAIKTLRTLKSGALIARGEQPVMTTLVTRCFKIVAAHRISDSRGSKSSRFLPCVEVPPAHPGTRCCHLKQRMHTFFCDSRHEHIVHLSKAEFVVNFVLSKPRDGISCMAYAALFADCFQLRM